MAPMSSDQGADHRTASSPGGAAWTSEAATDAQPEAGGEAPEKPEACHDEAAPEEDAELTQVGRPYRSAPALGLCAAA